MSGNDITQDDVTFRLTDMRVALALLTRLPLPYPPFDPARPAARAAWAYPLVGIVVAALMLAVIYAGLAIGLPPGVAALLALGASLLTTGAMHEDGLADCADGFWGGWTRARRLEIMKDSQIGTYGVLALVVSVGLRWQLIAGLINAEAILFLIPAAVMSRAAMVWIMFYLPHARETGLSHQTGKPGKKVVIAAICIGVFVLLFTTGQMFIPTILAIVLGLLGLTKLTSVKIGGQTGDVLGGTQQITEVVVLLVLLASVGSA